MLNTLIETGIISAAKESSNPVCCTTNKCRDYSTVKEHCKDNKEHNISSDQQDLYVKVHKLLM